MPDFTLHPVTPLGGHQETVGRLRLAEAAGLDLVSLAVPNGGDAEFAEAVRRAWDLALPVPGRSLADAAGRRLVWSGPQQYFLLLPAEPDGDPAARVSAQLGDSAYVTDQSDAWAILRLDGPDLREALARTCPLDLDPDVFGPDSAARTMMEHLGVFIIALAPDAVLLLSARSSAPDFLHAVRVSAYNVSEDAARGQPGRHPDDGSRRSE